ncbi:hypothetical protein BDR04DRAFT_1123535 [Suillus decipiens]|nr:hypothetical protein BDR04DRAFT_1123535 [Suillus decipiens]
MVRSMVLTPADRKIQRQTDLGDLHSQFGLPLAFVISFSSSHRLDTIYALSTLFAVIITQIEGDADFGLSGTSNGTCSQDRQYPVSRPLVESHVDVPMAMKFVKRTSAVKLSYVRPRNSGPKVSRITLGIMQYGNKGWQDWILGEDKAVEHIKTA